MNERDLWQLLSRLVQQQVQAFDHHWTPEQVEEFAVRIARGTWDGMILLLREQLAGNERVWIEELGAFARTEDGYVFHPAASLAQAGSMALPPVEGNLALARLALFYLGESVKVLSAIPPGYKMKLDDGTMTPGQELEFAIFGRVRSSALSERVRAVVKKLNRSADRIEGTGSVPATEDLPIEDLNLSVRARTHLLRLNVHTVGDLVQMKEEDLKSFEKTSLSEVKRKLAELDLGLGMAKEEESQ